MDKLKKIRQLKISDLSHEKQLKVCKIVLYVLAALIVAMNFTSLGLIGTEIIIKDQILWFGSRYKQMLKKQ